jgi:hypothetical protein
MSETNAAKIARKTREIEAVKQYPHDSPDPFDFDDAYCEIRRTRFGWSAHLYPARTPGEYRLDYIGGYGGAWRFSRKAIERKVQRLLKRERRDEVFQSVPVEIVR